MINDKPLVVSYETNINNTQSQLFKRTLEKYNWDFIFIGENEKWLGFKTRITGYYNFLNTLSDNKIVVLADARDVFCLRDATDFIKYVTPIIDDKIIISAECFLHGHINWSEEQINNVLQNDTNFFWQSIPLNNYWSYYNKTNNLPIRKYINAGLMIGKVKNLINAFKWILDNNYNDDQLGFANYTNKYPELIYLDYNIKFLHTSTGFVNGCLYDYSIQQQDMPTFAELFGMTSYFLHIPGLTISKGQQRIYNVISSIFECDDAYIDMFTLYKFSSKNLYGDYFIKN
jgi:hypothetical protein